jgi:phage terminase small subunit
MLDSTIRAAGWAMPGLKRQHILKSSDLGGFAGYCDQFSRWLKLRSETQPPGACVSSTRPRPPTVGEAYAPALSALIFVEEKLIKYEDRIGVNRAQRSALLTRPANVTDPDRHLR